MAKFLTGQTFGAGEGVSPAKMNAIVNAAEALPGLIGEQPARTAQALQADEVLMLNSASGALERVKVRDLGTPAGVVVAFGGWTAPEGWLPCDGSAVSRTTYARLFSVIEERYGAGDTSTTFNVPDTRGRVIAGRDTDPGSGLADRLTAAVSGIAAGTLGAVGGAQSIALSLAQTAAHTHGMKGVTVTGITFQQNSVNTGAQPRLQAISMSNGVTYTNANSPVGLVDSTDSQGSGAAHANAQPTIVLTSIIKT